MGETPIYDQMIAERETVAEAVMQHAIVVANDLGFTPKEIPKYILHDNPELGYDFGDSEE